MKKIDEEWKQLRKSITKKQAANGRLCFFCGVLYMLSEADGLTDEKYAAIYNELSAELAQFMLDENKVSTAIPT